MSNSAISGVLTFAFVLIGIVMMTYVARVGDTTADHNASVINETSRVVDTTVGVIPILLIVAVVIVMIALITHLSDSGPGGKR